MENDTVEKIVNNNYLFVDNKAKYYHQARNIQKRLQEYYRNLSKMKKLRKEIMLTIEM